MRDKNLDKIYLLLNMSTFLDYHIKIMT